MQRVYDFFRRHPTLVDGFWAAVLFGLSALHVSVDPLRRHAPAAWAVAGALALAMTLRRRAPERMLLLAMGAGLAQLAFDVRVIPADFALLANVYTAASTSVPWARRLALTGALSAAPLAELRWQPDQATWWSRVVSVVVATIPFAFAWVAGDRVRTRRAYYAQLEERAERLQREREAQARAAVAAERARIARELHDVVAHNVSVMVVQADGAAYVLDSSPEQARQALETIAQTGRLALAEMRRLLGLLRASDDTGGAYVPQPGVDELDELVEQVRGAGLPVTYAIAGAPLPLSSGVGLTAYRIVQEALTNTRKHGGPEARASVRLTYRDAELEMLIEDDGRGSNPELCSGGGADGLGQGLIGMRERITMVGGSLQTGPRPGGGFRIRAALPVKLAR